MVLILQLKLNDTSTIGDERGTHQQQQLHEDVPMVELMTINKALSGDNPENHLFFLLNKKQEHILG